MTEVFQTILDMSLTGSVVIGAVLLGRFVLRRQPKVFSYALWSVVLFRLLCPVSLSAPVALVQVSRPQVMAQGEVTSRVTYFPEPQTETVPSVTAEAERKLPAAAVLAWVWCAGAGGMAVQGVVSQWKLRRRLLGAVALRRGIYLADHIPSAFVAGLLRPRIYLPSGLEEGEMVYILAHEQCHIRRGDHIIKVMAYAALCLHWFNPLVWLAFCLAGKDMEMSCDEAAIAALGEEHRGDYAQVLLRRTTAAQKSFAVLSFGEGDTKGRVRNMAAWRRPKPWMLAAALALCCILGAACILNPGNPEGRFGSWVWGGSYEDITQESYTEYLQQAYGLSQVTDHRVYHRDGLIQVDLQFEKGSQQWQWESGMNFAVDKFYHRNAGRYHVPEYDLWLIDHAGERTKGLQYRCFVGGKLQMSVAYPSFQPEQKLKLTVHPGGDETLFFEGEALGGNFPDGMTYERIKTVDVTLEGASVPLEDALKQGLLTAEDIYSLARMDAKGGICQEIQESNQGVAGYTFRYADYSLLWVNDLYELPSGEPCPICYLVIYLPSNPEGTVRYHHTPSGRTADWETGHYNDREDWGLEFSVKEASPTAVTLHCRQSGGQQVGSLVIACSLLSDGTWPVDRIIHEDNTPWMEIPMNQESELTIDWSAICGEKEPGRYQLDIYVQDVYDKEALHPLLNKFHDIQNYQADFEIS